MELVGEFQEEQHHLLLFSQHNSVSNLLCTGAVCMDTNRNLIPLHNDIMHYVVMYFNGQQKVSKNYPQSCQELRSHTRYYVNCVP